MLHSHAKAANFLVKANVDASSVYLYGDSFSQPGHTPVCSGCAILAVEEKMSLRDLTKSALSFSWALSLLGAKQAVNLIQPRQRNGSNLFAPIAQVAADQLDESMRG